MDCLISTEILSSEKFQLLSGSLRREIENFWYEDLEIIDLNQVIIFSVEINDEK